MTIFVEVKIYTIIILLGVTVISTACPGPRFETNKKKLQDNNMDFPDLRKTYYNGIHFLLPSMFTQDYNTNYVLTDNAETNVIYDLDVNFSVESFTKSDAELIQYAFDEKIDALNAVHDNYILRRQESLNEYSSSIKKEVPKAVGFPGYTQVVHGGIYDDGVESTYFTATIEINDIYFVFQMIGKKENMGYLYDDFIDILASLEK